MNIEQNLFTERVRVANLHWQSRLDRKLNAIRVHHDQQIAAVQAQVLEAKTYLERVSQGWVDPEGREE